MGIFISKALSLDVAVAWCSHHTRSSGLHTYCFARCPSCFFVLLSLLIVSAASSAHDIKPKLIKTTREKMWWDNFLGSWSSGTRSSSTGAAPWAITAADCSKLIHLNSKHSLMRCIVNSKDAWRTTPTWDASQQTEKPLIITTFHDKNNRKQEKAGRQPCHQHFVLVLL